MSEKIKISLYSKNKKSDWMQDFIKIAQKIPGVIAESIHHLDEDDKVIFIHENEEEIQKILTEVTTVQRTFFLITENEKKIPTLLKQEYVEDVLVYPFRVVEVLGKLKIYQNILLFRELNGIHSSLQNMITSLQDNVELASRIKKSFAPQRFQKLKALSPHYRYFSGESSGGNYFDILPHSQESSYSLLLSDSSSYGLSSLILTLVLNIAQKVNQGQNTTPHQIAELLLQELTSTLRPKDHLSLFLGNISRFNLVLHYIHFGDNVFLHSHKGGAFHEILPTGGALKLTTQFPLPISQTLQLHPMDQIVLLSQGLVYELGGVSAVLSEVNSSKVLQAEEIFEKLTLSLRSSLKKNKKEFPTKDCTISFIEVNKKIVPLRKIENVG